MKKKIPNIISSFRIILASVMLFFALPFISRLLSVPTGLAIVCTISTIACIETITIQLTSKELRY